MQNPLDVEVHFGSRTNRTIREILLISGGIAFTVSALFRHEPWLFVGVYGFATLVFASRFFAARAFAVATSIAALTQQVVCTDFSPSFDSWLLYVPIAVLAGMLSRDLVARFDRAPSGVPFLPNRWATLPEADAWRLRVCAYALASQAAALFCSRMAEVYLWPKIGIGVLWGALLLLTMGRAVVVFLAPLITIPVGYIWYRELVAHPEVCYRPPSALLLVVGPLCAAVACIVAAPYLRHVVRVLRRSA